MLSRHAKAVAGPLLRQATASSAPASLMVQRRWLSQADVEDPNMNGGYVNPPAVKRQFRDPYGDWWDKQERRNYGEPVHEDNDILGVFSPEEYTHQTPGQAGRAFGAFVLAVLGVSAVVSVTYSDRPSAPKEYPGGLDRELGGAGSLRARKPGDEF